MKKFLTVILCCFFLTCTLIGCNKKDGLTTVKLNEVTHSVFYAPLYVAIENGYFKDEGLKIELTNGGGADNSMTAVLSKTADIGLMGPETVIYVHNQGKVDSPVVFAQLTQKDGSFLVSRKAEPEFSWENLKGKEILAGRRGGVPAMTFEFVLNNLSMVQDKDFTFNFSVQYNLMTSAFISGVADYCTVFEPTASEYEKQGIWHVVASVGEQSGEIPYTSFIALKSFIKNKETVVKSFLKAMKKAYQFMEDSSELTVAEAIVKQFPSTTINSIETSIKSYKKIDAWRKDMLGTENAFNRLQDVMINSGELQQKVPFSDIVDNTLVKNIFN